MKIGWNSALSVDENINERATREFVRNIKLLDEDDVVTALVGLAQQLEGNSHFFTVAAKFNHLEKK